MTLRVPGNSGVGFSLRRALARPSRRSSCPLSRAKALGRLKPTPLPAVVFLLVIALTGCGYRVAGHADLLPKNIKTIAVPAFGNVTLRYKLADRITAQVTREFIERTRYAVVADPKKADAVLTGAVTNFVSYPTTFDAVTQRASGAQVILNLQILLMDKNGKVLFNRPGMEVREHYQIAVDAAAYFDESGPAMDRLARDVARSIVSAVLENF
jgi:lipopolysaccharide assembly LptE-like protein